VAFVELGLRQPDHEVRVRAAGYAKLSEGLVGAMLDTAPEAAVLKTGEFRREVTAHVERLREARDEGAFGREVVGLLSCCRQQFERVRRHVGEREAGFAEIIETLTAAVDELAGESLSFNKNVIGESDRIRRLLELDDVSELKRRVTERVDALRQAVAERQQKEDTSRLRLSGRVRSLQSKLSEAEAAASADQLTGVGNRRQFEASLGRFVAEACDTGRSFALAMLDVDDFKQVNDQHGHQVGDRVLVALAQSIARRLRKGDVVTRYGGEEFALLLRDTTAENAGKRLAQVVDEIAASDFAYEGSRRVRFTVSVGVAGYWPGDSDGALVRRADEGLYAAKRGGKTRVVVAPRRASGSATAMDAVST
jgi:diguanylate cyclase (GGDEF)-like protein